MDIVATLEFRPFSIVSLITFHFGEQIFGSGKASKQAYSVLYNCFGNEVRGKKMPPKWKVIDDTMLNDNDAPGQKSFPHAACCHQLLQIQPSFLLHGVLLYGNDTSTYPDGYQASRQFSSYFSESN